MEDRSFHSSFHWLLLSTESKATQSGAPRAPALHPAVFLLSDEGKAPSAVRQPIELTSYQISLYTLL
jgi:hypothetical protein